MVCRLWFANDSTKELLKNDTGSEGGRAVPIISEKSDNGGVRGGGTANKRPCLAK